MKGSIIVKSASELSQDNAERLLQACMNPETTESNIYEQLMTLVRSFKEILLTYSHESVLQKNIVLAKRISSVLRRHSQRTGNLKYYYFGMYHAKLEQIEEELLERQITAKQQEVAGRKYFADIMQVLYTKEMIQQRDLANQLAVDKSNLSREMSRLVQAGFVEERKAGKFKLYNLSTQGYSFYNKYLLMHSLLISPRQSFFSNSINKEGDIIDIPLQYQENYSSALRRTFDERIVKVDFADIEHFDSDIEYDYYYSKNELIGGRTK